MTPSYCAHPGTNGCTGLGLQRVPAVHRPGPRRHLPAHPYSLILTLCITFWLRVYSACTKRAKS